jgi:hypothetical protein
VLAEGGLAGFGRMMSGSGRAFTDLPGSGRSDWTRLEGWKRRERPRKTPMSGHLRIRAVRFPQTKSLDTFDFDTQSSLNKAASLNKALTLELARYELD